MRILNDVNTLATVLALSGLYYYSNDGSPVTLNRYWLNWVQYLNSFEFSNSFAFTLTFQVIVESFYWFLVTNLHILERTGLLEKYRLQPIPTDEDKLKKEAELKKEAIINVLVGHWVIRPLAMYFLYPYTFQRVVPSLMSPLPSIRLLMFQFFLCMMIDDTWFYWAHRTCHLSTFLYQKVHKQHHRFYRPNVFATEYAHPVEDLFVNSMGTILGPILLGAHPFLLIVYSASKMYQSMESHSGFNIPFPLSITCIIDSMDCAPAHDFHHSHNIGNFGGWFMFWDWICGTDNKYENHVMVKKRDVHAYKTARRPYQNDEKKCQIM